MNIKPLQRLQKLSGIAGILVLWTFIIIGMIQAHLGLIDKLPISYLGVDPKTRTFFMIGLIVSALLFISFGRYISRAYKIGNRFYEYLLIGQLCQIIVGLVPDSSHNHYKLIHTIAAFALAFSLPLLIRQFYLSQVKTKHAVLYLRLLRFEQSTFIIGIGLFVFTSGIAPLGEALPTFGFHVWIIVLTIMTMRSKGLSLSKT